MKMSIAHCYFIAIEFVKYARNSHLKEYRLDAPLISAGRSSSSSAHVIVARTRRNELQCSNLSNTLEQLSVVIERRVDRACTRCGMVMAASGEHLINYSRRRGVPWSYSLR